MPSLAASAVLLAAFVVIEARSRHPLLPLRLLRNRNRVGAYLIMLGVGTAIFGVFFFLTLFVQDVWGYSALRTGRRVPAADRGDAGRPRSRPPRWCRGSGRGRCWWPAAP